MPRRSPYLAVVLVAVFLAAAAQASTPQPPPAVGYLLRLPRRE